MLFGGGSYVVGIALRWTSNGVQTLLANERATISAMRAADRYKAKMAEVQAAQLRAGTMFAGGIALAGGAAIAAGVAQAAKFELAMTAIGLSINASSSQLKALQQTALKVSDITAQSATTIAQEMAVASTTGLNTLGFARFNQLFPILAKFADVQYFIAKGKGQEMSPTQAISYGVQFAHMFQAFTPDRMRSMLEWITKLTMVVSDPQKALTQAKYFVPLGTALGMSMSDMFPLMAIMGQTGFLTGRGGTSVKNIIMGAIDAATLTGHGQGKQTEALKELGILVGRHNVVVTGKGMLDWGKLTQVLESAAKRLHPDAYARDVKAAFGSSAAPFATVLNTPAVQTQLERIRRMMEGLGNDPIGVFFDRMMNNFLPAFQKFVTNFVNLGINTFLPVLPQLTTFFTNFANVLGTAGAWMGAHPDAAKGIADIIFAISGLAALRFAAGGIGMIAGALNLLKGTEGMGFFFKALTALDNFAFLGLGGKILGLRTAISTLSVAGSVAGGVTTLGIAIGALGSIATAYAGSLFAKEHGASAAELRQFGLGYAGLWALEKLGLRMPSSQARASRDVHVHGNVVFQLPKGTDPGYARRMMQSISRTFGASATSSGHVIIPGSYNSVPSTP